MPAPSKGREACARIVQTRIVCRVWILQNLLNLSQIAAFWVDAVYGAIILLSLIIARLGGQKPRS